MIRMERRKKKRERKWRIVVRPENPGNPAERNSSEMLGSPSLRCWTLSVLTLMLKSKRKTPRTKRKVHKAKVLDEVKNVTDKDGKVMAVVGGQGHEADLVLGEPGAGWHQDLRARGVGARKVRDALDRERNVTNKGRRGNVIPVRHSRLTRLNKRRKRLGLRHPPLWRCPRSLPVATLVTT